MTIANVPLTIEIGSCAETAGVDGLTVQPVIVELTDTPIVQHVTESTIVVSIAGQRCIPLRQVPSD